MEITNLFDSQYPGAGGYATQWLAAGEVLVIEYPIDHNVAGIYPNDASITVMDNELNEASASDSESVRVYHPELTLEKSGIFDAGADGFADVGELITYTFVVTNTGEVTLSNITVADPKVTDIAYVSGDLNDDGLLQLTETWAYSGTYAVTQADIDAGFVYNLATADSDESPPDTDDNNEPLPQDPKLNIVKDGTFDAGG